MFYDFPVGLSLDEVRLVVNAHNDRLGMKSFIEADRGDFVIFNYVVSTPLSFPPPNTGDPVLDRHYAILRECRGLTFSKETGKVLARKYSKFFNVDEKPETQSYLVDWSQPHLILEKLDGSMLVPCRVGDGIDWHTKMGMTDVALPVMEFVSKNPHYDVLADACIGSDFTPIFEWCSRKQRIVIDYPVDQLILTAIRNNNTGAYMSHAEMIKLAGHYGIPVVRALPGSVENIQEFMKETRALEDSEGYVIRFDNGHMLKCKAELYCRIHGTKDAIQHEKDVWALILEERMDDAKTFMDDGDRDRVERFETAFMEAVSMKAAALEAIASHHRTALAGDKKRFALEVAPGYSAFEKQLLFQLWDGKDPVKAVLALLAKNCSTKNRVEEVRPLVCGLRWDDYRDTNAVLDD